MAIEPGALVNLNDQPGTTYQVINVDARSDCAWVRRWPLRAKRHHHTFAVPLTHLGDAAPRISPPGLQRPQSS